MPRRGRRRRRTLWAWVYLAVFGLPDEAKVGEAAATPAAAEDDTTDAADGSTDVADWQD